MDPMHPRPANHPRKSTRNSERSIRGSHHDSNGRYTKTPRRRRSSTRDRERLDTKTKSSSPISRSSGDGVKDSVVSARAEKLSADTTVSEDGGRRMADGGGSSSGSRLEAAQEEGEDDEREFKTLDVADDVSDAASDDSFSDNIVSSRRRYDGGARGLVRGGSSGGGQGKDEGGRSGGVKGRCWKEHCKGGNASTRCNSLVLSYERGNTTDLVQCVIVRDVSGLDTIREKKVHVVYVSALS